MAASTSSWHCRSSEFRKLLCHISQNLKGNEIQQIEYICRISRERREDSLGVLTALENRGEFSANHTEPLVQLLQDIYRHDLAEHVKNVFQAIYPDDERDLAITADTPDCPPIAGSAPNYYPFSMDEFDRSSVGTLPVSRTSRLTARRASDSGIVISVKMPIENAHSLTQKATFGQSKPRTFSVHSMVSSNSGRGTSTTSIRLTSEVFDESSGPVTAIQHISTAADCSLEPPTKLSHHKGHGFSGWKQIFSWRRKKDGGSDVSQKRISKYTWSIESQVLLHKRYMQRINSPEHMAIDIECGQANPYVSLCLYPQGLFDDAEKSMTLQYKVVIPDDCPPVPTKATFDLSWEFFARGEQSFRTLESQKQCIQVKFKIGMGYIYKFLPHSQLPDNDFVSLEIHVRVSTAYSVPGT